MHIAVSVGWIGALAGYIALDVTAATASDPAVLRAAYLGMATIAGNVIVWLAYAALATGIAISLGSKWGLFRHYWVLISFVLTAVATGVLWSELQLIRSFAVVAGSPSASAQDLRALDHTLVHSIGGTIVLLVILGLNVYKPAGLTRYGWRQQQRERGVQP